MFLKESSIQVVGCLTDSTLHCEYALEQLFFFFIARKILQDHSYWVKRTAEQFNASLLLLFDFA